MSEVVVTARKWGNSIGVTFPAELVEREMIRPNDRVVVIVKRARPIKELFGTLKTRKSTAELMREVREGWD